LTFPPSRDRSSSPSTKADINTIGGGLSRASSTAMPPHRGIRRSRRTNRASSCPRRVRATSPSSATSTEKPETRSTSAREERTASSSSTTRTSTERLVDSGFNAIPQIAKHVSPEGPNASSLAKGSPGPLWLPRSRRAWWRWHDGMEVRRAWTPSQKVLTRGTTGVGVADDPAAPSNWSGVGSDDELVLGSGISSTQAGGHGERYVVASVNGSMAADGRLTCRLR